MVSIALASELREQGLEWQPQLHDFFSIPHTSLENRLFVVSDMMIDVQRLYGNHIITFNGAVEWSLDYIAVAEALWVPTETQLRKLALDRLGHHDGSSLRLESGTSGYQCKITWDGEMMTFEAKSASDAYALALLHLLKNGWGRSES